MANYRKSFNFRTGLQVDNDNFVVNANGLVGIGTSVPENYLLNVYGDTRVTGVVTTATLNAGVGTVSTLSASNSNLGVTSVTSIRIGSGPVITNLVGYAYSTFLDDAVGGISTTSRIGIGTTADSTAQFKVLGDSIFTGNIDASTGIVTASSFVGDITGTVTGTATTATNLADGANITTGTIDDARLPDLITSNINISSGISTISQVVVGSAVTINSGGINASSGIVTASTFVGGLTGTATTATNLSDGANITTGTINDARLPDLITSNINSTGISTFSTLKLGSAIEMTGASGIITATSFSGPITGAVTGNADTATALQTARNFSITGDTEASAVSFAGTSNVVLSSSLSSSFSANTSGIITASSFVGGLTGTATTATNLADGANITTGTISNDRLPNNINKPTGIITASSFVGGLTGTATTATNLSDGANITTGTIDDARLPNLITSNINNASGISTVNELNVGTDGAGLTALSTGNLGIGTTNPTSELLIRKSSGSLLEVISDSGQARISIGNSVGVGNSSGVLRFGNSEKVFEIVNNDVGDFKYIIGRTGNPSTGNFVWVDGGVNQTLMSLTNGGNLGIGITNPSNKLHVVGTSTITQNLYVDNNLIVGGDITYQGDLALPNVIESNINVVSGISTFNRVSIAGSVGIGITVTPTVDIDARGSVALFNRVGLGTDVDPTTAGTTLAVNGETLLKGFVGIGTTGSLLYGGSNFSNIQLFYRNIGLYESKINVKPDSQIGFNTNDPRSILDYGNVGGATTRPVVVVPNINNTTITGIAETPAGSIIFNTTTSKFQGYTGVAWTDFH